MKRLSVCRAGLLLGLVGISASAEAGVPGPTSRGTVSISVTIAPHVVMSEASGSMRDGVGDTATALCIGSRGLTPYSATLIARVNGRSEAIDLPLVRSAQLPADSPGCAQGTGADATIYLDRGVMRAIERSTGPATLLIVPD